jgi:hypothetical protein
MGARSTEPLQEGWSRPERRNFGYGGSSDMMIVPDAANMPPTPWQTEILAPGIGAGAVPRIWRTLRKR